MFREIADGSDLTDLKLFDTCPPASDRQAWEALPGDYCRKLIEAGEKWLGCKFCPSMPQITWSFAAQETEAAMRKNCSGGGLG